MSRGALIPEQVTREGDISPPDGNRGSPVSARGLGDPDTPERRIFYQTHQLVSGVDLRLVLSTGVLCGQATVLTPDMDLALF